MTIVIVIINIIIIVIVMVFMIFFIISSILTLCYTISGCPLHVRGTAAVEAEAAGGEPGHLAMLIQRSRKVSDV